ncbi:hypothetical protein [Streptomyces sp. NPDC048462]|uniref:hypothetical protein n=1 Tax=Streptomyces sp. NPDC048462 TaxID=3365555 RepID=UPI00371B1BEA
METTSPQLPQLAPEQIRRAADYVELVWQEQGSEEEKAALAVFHADGPELARLIGEFGALLLADYLPVVPDEHADCESAYVMDKLVAVASRYLKRWCYSGGGAEVAYTAAGFLIECMQESTRSASSCATSATTLPSGRRPRPPEPSGSRDGAREGRLLPPRALSCSGGMSQVANPVKERCTGLQTSDAVHSPLRCRALPTGCRASDVVHSPGIGCGGRHRVRSTPHPVASTPGPVVRIAVGWCAPGARAAHRGAVVRAPVRIGARTVGAVSGVGARTNRPVVRIVAPGALLGSARRFPRQGPDQANPLYHTPP